MQDHRRAAWPHLTAAQSAAARPAAASLLGRAAPRPRIGDVYFGFDIVGIRRNALDVRARWIDRRGAQPLSRAEFLQVACE